ncbi:MAG: amidohydrolase family protein [Chloroflexi bacterium]|nr:amidohydrolase family protein [Chloroflexota bacterium]
MTTIKLPGLIDPHVHVRDLNQSHKEDWDSCTASALAGGITCVMAMPNTQPPITNLESLKMQQEAARARARCDYGIFLGAGVENIETAHTLASQTSGLKMYLDQTFGPLRLDNLDSLVAHAERWDKNRPLLCHAEGRTVAAAILVAHLANRSVHICHVSRKDEIELIAAAKMKGIQVTCEVCPHHLFLTLEGCRLPAGYIEVRPRLATQEDVDALWANLEAIDCFATDHAPHTRQEKESDSPPPGYPELETALPLWLTAIHENRLTLDDIVKRMCNQPQKIFGVPTQADTWIEIDTDLEWTARGETMFSRAKWTPFEGWKMKGKVTAVYLREELVYDGEKVLAPLGTGRNINEETL